MNLDYKIEHRDDILWVDAHGTLGTIEDAKAYFIAVANALKDNNTIKVVCDDCEIDYKLDIVDTYELGKFVSRSLPQMVRIAIVFNPAYKEEVSFWENVVNNLGLTIKTFTDYDKAVNWVNK